MRFPSTVLVHEFYTGGGFPPGEMPAGLSVEALGMFWALLEDFRAWGAVRTLAAFDRRMENRAPGLTHKTLPADEVILVEPGRHAEVFAGLLERCDAALIIAPETDGILAGLSAQVEANGVTLLGSSAAATAAAGDKAVCDTLFRQAGLPAPLSRITQIADAPAAAAELGYPLVVKPLDGVGCEGVCQVDGPADLSRALEMTCRATAHETILLQTAVQGVHASVSLLAAEDRSLPISLNRQVIRSGCPFQYLGSETPLAHPAAERACDLAQAAVARIPGLRGYIGVDLILSDTGVQIIEINPRLTTSYIALRQVAQSNLAAAIWNASVLGILPAEVRLVGRAAIAKNDPASWRLITRSAPAE